MTENELGDIIVWAAFLADVAFLVIYLGLPPYFKWWRYQMGWHLVMMSLSLGIVLGTSVARHWFGPVPFWVAAVEVSFVACVTWWRAIYALFMKFKAMRSKR